MKLEAPSGWKRVRRGIVREGDLDLIPHTWVFRAVRASWVGGAISWSDFVIRRVEKPRRKK